MFDLYSYFQIISISKYVRMGKNIQLFKDMKDKVAAGERDGKYGLVFMDRAAILRRENYSGAKIW